MSVGAFMGIRASFVDDAREAADSLVAACQLALQENGFPRYQDPEEPPDVYTGFKFGRSSLDHHAAARLVEVAELADVELEASHLGVISLNPYRMVFLPVALPRPVLTGYIETISGQEVAIWLCSSFGLLDGVLKAAPKLGIPLKDGMLSDEIAAKIDDLAPLYVGIPAL